MLITRRISSVLKSSATVLRPPPVTDQSIGASKLLQFQRHDLKQESQPLMHAGYRHVSNLPSASAARCTGASAVSGPITSTSILRSPSSRCNLAVSCVASRTGRSTG